MIIPRLRAGAALLAALVALVLVTHRTRLPDRSASSKSSAPSPSSAPASRAAPAVPTVPADSRRDPPREEPRGTAIERLAYSQFWDGPLPPAMTAFRGWTERYRATREIAARATLEAEGLALARARRAEMRRMIVTDPQRALAIAVPVAIRQSLPTTILAELETRHAGRGDFALQVSQPEAGAPRVEPALRRIVYLGGATYEARPYGRRESQLTKEGASLHGIALDGEFALHESPARLLEAGETTAQPAEPICAACAKPWESQTTGLANADTNASVSAWVEAEGRVWRVHVAELDEFEHRILATEAPAGPRVLSLAEVLSGVDSGAPALAAEPAVPFTVGAKQVLVIRTDFSDFPGEPVSQASAQALLDGAVKSFFEDTSYGETTLVTTVSSQLYRLPRPGATYATSNDRNGLHADARAAAAADYTLANYDRLIVVFPNIGSSRVPGSRLTFAGLANAAGANAWINGPASFVLATVSHELGHTYGLLHSNLWRVTDGNPISGSGTTLEYGDPFDMMGSTAITSVTRDARHHYNMWHKNRMGWLPDEAVTTVTRSGTYRVHRFDARGAPRTQPLALRIFRDGVRWYWVGLRQNFASGTPRADGAYVIWGHNQRLQSQLLDLTTPGRTATDAALAVDATFSDPAYGVTIKPIGRGGDEPSQWLDIEVTVTAAPPNVVTAWGREGATFYDNETGDNLVPAPETNVPMGLANVQAIAAGDQHALALRHDGTVVAWGNHTSGQVDVPAGIEAIAIAAGGNVSGAVLRDGTVRMWGDINSGLLTPPADLRDVRQLAIGGGGSARIYHALALRADGTIVGWGDNTRNQITVPGSVTRATAIAASDRLSVALRPDGTVVRWGTTFTGALPFPTNLSGITAIAANGSSGHALALRGNGTVAGWGVNTSGQATPPAGLDNVIAIATGNAHSLALRNDGTVVTWGSATSGRLLVPRAMPRVAAISGSALGSFALTGTRFVVLTHPTAQTVAAGGPAELQVDAVGSGPLAYQWRKDGVAIAGATGSSHRIAQVSASDQGNYDVIITDRGLTTRSAIARLAVDGAMPPPSFGPSRIANLSIRTAAGTDAQTLIVGFAVGGANTAGTKPLLLRAVGPTLGEFGVGGTLGDPKIELFDSAQTKLLENDNWNAGDAAVFASLGAFPLGTASRDAALFNNALPAGSYSAQVSGAGAASGVVLAEIYDATATEALTVTTPRLVNVSARAVSGRGADVLIAGFTISGTASKTILIRAIGPTLGVFGVSDVLADPKVELFNALQLKIQENDNWGGAASVSAAFASVAAFPLPADSRDAAMLATLQPGGYTAQVSGANGGTGVALIEVYELPE